MPHILAVMVSLLRAHSNLFATSEAVCWEAQVRAWEMEVVSTETRVGYGVSLEPSGPDICPSGPLGLVILWDSGSPRQWLLKGQTESKDAQGCL